VATATAALPFLMAVTLRPRNGQHGTAVQSVRIRKCTTQIRANKRPHLRNGHAFSNPSAQFDRRLTWIDRPNADGHAGADFDRSLMGEGLGPYEHPAEAFLSGSISACTENGFVRNAMHPESSAAMRTAGSSFPVM
jgi:hypothetical protein